MGPWPYRIRAARPRPSEQSSAPAPGVTGWRWRQERPTILGSSRSAAPTCAAPETRQARSGDPPYVFRNTPPYCGVRRPQAGGRANERIRAPGTDPLMVAGRGGARLEGGGEPQGEHDEQEAHGVIPGEFFLEHEPGEADEDHQRDALLDDLELITAETAAEIARAVRRHHQAVFEKGDAPRSQNDEEERFALQPLELQLPIPGEGHEDVGADEEKNGFHGWR